MTYYRSSGFLKGVLDGVVDTQMELNAMKLLD